MNKKIIFESNVEVYKNELQYTVRIYNLLRTMGNTIGNIIRRLLITNVPGTSVQGFHITGLDHNFDHSNNFDKDADQIGETIREIIFTYQSNIPSPYIIETVLIGPKRVTAQDLFPNIKIINGDMEVFQILNKNQVTFKAWLINGVGFIPYYQQEVEDGVIAVTSIFTHNKNVTFDVAHNNIDDKYEDLTIKFTTYEIFVNDHNATIKYALQNLIVTVQNIFHAIDNTGEDMEEEDQENALLRQVEDIINQSQGELATYIYDQGVELTDLPKLIELIDNLPANTTVNNVKIKRKERTAVLKSLAKLQKTITKNNQN